MKDSKEIQEIDKRIEELYEERKFAIKRYKSQLAGIFIDAIEEQIESYKMGIIDIEKLISQFEVEILQYKSTRNKLEKS